MAFASVSSSQPRSVRGLRSISPDHPELYREALEPAQRMGMFEKRRRKLLPVMITKSGKAH